MTTANLQRLIQSDPRATARVLRYLDRLGVEHSGRISGGTLAKVCGKNSRSWRMWTSGDRTMPTESRRLLCEVSGVQLPWVALPVERLPKALQHVDGEEVLVRLANGSEVPAWWRSQVGGIAGAYYDADGEPLEPVAVLAG
jgi:hypothetical protein